MIRGMIVIRRMEGRIVGECVFGRIGVFPRKLSREDVGIRSYAEDLKID